MTDDSSLPRAVSIPRDPLQPTRPLAAPRVALEPLESTASRVGLARFGDRLAEVRSWLEDDLTRLDRELEELSAAATCAPDLAKQAAVHLIGRPGKRIRPVCVLLGARLAGLPAAVDLGAAAVACELVHAATLLHDDVIDEGTERRGAPAARTVYGNSASILAGDYLLVEALERVSRAGADSTPPARRMELMQSLLHTIAQMVAAEALQLEQRGRFRPALDSYLRVIEGKTASLFRWALSAAPILAGSPAPVRAALARAGTELGVAFQLVDDLLDLDGDAAAIGKDLFADLLQGKLTHPLIVAAGRDATLTAEVRALAETAEAGGVDARRAAGVVARIRASGALDATRALADEKRASALAALDELPDSPARRALSVVVEAAVARSR